MKLTAKQTLALDFLEDNSTKELVYGGAAGGGKSVLGCFWIVKMALRYPGARLLIGRSELKTLKKTTLVTFFEVSKQQGLEANKHFRYNQQDSIIYFANGSQIILADLFSYPSDPEFDSLGSLEITAAFLDECNQMTEKAKNIVKSRIRYKLDEYGLIPKQLMTCNPAKNWVYSEFYRPSVEGRLADDKKFIQALVTDNVYISSHYVENLRTLDKNSRERLLNGNWEYDDDPSALIDYDKIIDCFSNVHVQDGTKYICADIARFGSDSTVIGVYSGYRVKLFQYKGKSVSEVADIIQEMQMRYGVANSNTIVDEDGVGGGVCDILRCKGFVNNSRPKDNPETRQPDNFVNLKSQCYYRLADRINRGELYIDTKDINIRQAIIEELEQVKAWNVDKDGKRAIIPKDKVKELIGRSPDFSDTLMMREWFELTTKMSWIAF